MPQKVTITDGGFQDILGNKLAKGYLQARLQQDVGLGVQVAAGRLNTIPLDVDGNVLGEITLWGPATYAVKAYDFRGQHVWTANTNIPDAPTYSLTPSSPTPTVPTVVQSSSGDYSTGAVLPGISSSNRLIVCVNWVTFIGGAVLSAQDNLGNVYELLVTSGSVDGVINQAIYIVKNPIAGDATITASLLNATGAIMALEVSGLAVDPLDVAAASQGTTSTSMDSGNTGSTTQVNELVIGFGGSEGSESNPEISAGVGFTSLPPTNYGFGINRGLTEYKIAGSLAVQSAQMTLDQPAVRWGMFCVALKAI